MFCGSHQSVWIIWRPLLATNQFKLLQPDDAYSYRPRCWVPLSNVNISADSWGTYTNKQCWWYSELQLIYYYYSRREDGKQKKSVHCITEMPKDWYNMTYSLFQGFQLKNDENYLSTAVFMWGSLWILYIFEVLSKIVLHKRDVRYFFSSFLPFQTQRLWNCDL